MSNNIQQIKVAVDFHRKNIDKYKKLNINFIADNMMLVKRNEELV